MANIINLGNRTRVDTSADCGTGCTMYSKSPCSAHNCFQENSALCENLFKKFLASIQNIITTRIVLWEEAAMHNMRNCYQNDISCIHIILQLIWIEWKVAFSGWSNQQMTGRIWLNPFNAKIMYVPQYLYCIIKWSLHFAWLCFRTCLWDWLWYCWAYS